MSTELIENQPERLPTETSKAFAAFCCYLKLGPARSIAKAYAAAKVQQNTSKTAVPRHWFHWSKVNDWQRRSSDFDLHLELQARAQRQAEHHAELEAYRTRQKHLAQATTESALKLLKLANQKIEELQKAYDDWKARLEAAETPEERAAIRRNDPINLLSIPNWIRAAASVAQVATDAESQALAVNELLHILEDSDRFRLPMTPER